MLERGVPTQEEWANIAVFLRAILFGGLALGFINGLAWTVQRLAGNNIRKDSPHDKQK